MYLTEETISTYMIIWWGS